jgi:hypothetical protein
MRAFPRHSIASACAAILLAAAASEAQSASLTGTYVGRNDHQAFVLQIVEAGSQLTGRYEQFVAKSGGKFEDTTFAFTAAVDGDRFAGTIKNMELLGSTIPVSGDLAGDTLRVEGDASFHLALKRGDISDFRAAIAQLKGAASTAQREAAVGALIGRIDAFEAKLSQSTSRLPAAETHLVANTARMSSLLDREKSIRGDGQRSVARGQLSVNIHQVGVDSQQLRSSVDFALTELHGSSESLVHDAALARLSCLNKAAPLPSCPRFAEADASLKKSIDDGKAAFAKFDESWDRESAMQRSLMDASDAAVN